MSTTFEWSPYLPYIYYVLLAVGAGAALLFVLFKRMWDFSWRALFFAALVFLLLNPIILNEIRQGLPDKFVIVVDDSASERIGGRDKVAEQALQSVLDKLKQFNNIDPVVIHSGSDLLANKGESTNLFTALRNNLMSIPLAQVSGAVFITDGQVHDVPAELGAMERLAPFHAILTGRKDEFDRKINVVSAPKYGVLSEEISISVRIEETGGHNSGPMSMGIYQDGQRQQEVMISPGETRQFSFKVEHPGQNVYEFAVPVADGELTPSNNRAPVIVNGIRDRLRVLLITGSPHMGERSWRNLLKADPSVDLIQFTILRPPDSWDNTPESQLSLIQFPDRLLFVEKINEFDLIILDRWQNYARMDTPLYFTNIANYVRRGGAFLMALGTGDTAQTTFQGTLEQILPVDVSGVMTGGQSPIVKLPYVPELTALGKQHPVTADLQKQFEKKKWGAWQTQVDAPKLRGDTLMTGVNGKPLLLLDKTGEGRVAVLASDNVWLWSKGQNQAGPYTDLLRNVAHWLMKEPELEDDFIKAEAKGSVITVSERDLTPDAKSVQMTMPSGEQQTISLTNRVPGWITADIIASASGIYTFDNGRKKAFAVVGSASNQEFADVQTTADKLKPIVDRTKGSIIWFQENQGFSIKEVGISAGDMGSDKWLGIKRNKAYTVDNVESLSLVPNWLCLLVILSLCVWAWWRESGVR
ncbi:MAG: hypothetical protein ACAH83_15210 [Alphaproteobacteria bacterium]